MKTMNLYKVGSWLLALSAAQLMSSCCGGDPEPNILLSPPVVEVAHGESITSEATFRIGTSEGPAVNWSLSDSPELGKTLSSWTLDPSFNSTKTTVTVTAKDEFDLDNSFFLGNANELKVFVFGLNNEISRPASAGEHLRVTAYALKLGASYQSIKPTYIVRDLGSHYVSKMDLDAIVEVLYDPTPLAYTFEVKTAQVQVFYEYFTSGHGGTGWKGVEGAADLSTKVGTSGKSCRIQGSVDTSASLDPPANTKYTNVNVQLNITARRSDGREVQGIFHFTKMNGCHFCD